MNRGKEDSQSDRYSHGVRNEDFFREFTNDDTDRQASEKNVWNWSGIKEGWEDLKKKKNL